MLSLFLPQASPRHLRLRLAQWLLLSVDLPHCAGEAGGRNTGKQAGRQVGAPHFLNLAAEPHTNKHVHLCTRCMKQRNCVCWETCRQDSSDHCGEICHAGGSFYWSGANIALLCGSLGSEGENVCSSLFTVGILARVLQYYLRFWDEIPFLFISRTLVGFIVGYSWLCMHTKHFIQHVILTRMWASSSAHCK